MPEELVIILVVIIGVGWLLIKILQAIGETIGETDKAIRAGLTKRKNE